MVWLSAVTWDFPLVGRTRMLTEAWLGMGQPTTFVQVPSYRTAAEKLLRPIRSSPSHVVQPWPTAPAFSWTRLGEDRLRRAITPAAKALARDLARRISFQDSVALVVSPVWVPWLDSLPFRAVIYDCIDNLEVMTPRADLAPLYRCWEGELIDRSAAVVTSARGLAANIRGQRPDIPVETIRNGVDVDAFVQRAASADRPPDLPRQSGRPLVGFVGALYEWIDWRLIGAVAAELTGFDFVFVGPSTRQGPPDSVAKMPNVTLLGSRPYPQIPAYVAAFDVCWLPFAPGNVSRDANPVKLYEYLSLGRPVVSTPIADTDSFRGLVEFGTTPGEISTAIRRAVSGTVESVAQRVAFARENSWSVRARAYLDFVETIGVGS